MGSFHDWIVNEWIWWVNQHLVIVFIFHLLRFGTVNDSTISWDRAKITYHIKCDMYHITGTGLCSSPVYCTVQWYECCLAFGFFHCRTNGSELLQISFPQGALAGRLGPFYLKKKASIQVKMTHQISVKPKKSTKSSNESDVKTHPSLNGWEREPFKQNEVNEKKV